MRWKPKHISTATTPDCTRDFTIATKIIESGHIRYIWEKCPLPDDVLKFLRGHGHNGT